MPCAAVSSDERAAAQCKRRCDPAHALCSVNSAQRRTMIIASASVSVSVSNVHTHPKCWSRCLSLRAVSMKISLQGSRWLPAPAPALGACWFPKVNARASFVRTSRPCDLAARDSPAVQDQCQGHQPSLSAVRRALASWQWQVNVDHLVDLDQTKSTSPRSASGRAASAIKRCRACHLVRFPPNAPRLLVPLSSLPRLCFLDPH